jgi:hemolysin III
MASFEVTRVEDRPSWRGWIHAAAFLAAIPAGVMLILHAHRASARVAASIYAASLLLGFGTSAAYHRLARSPRTQRIMQRLDHSMIFVLIAGTYTPVALLGMSAGWGIPVLCVVWTGAVAGVLIKQFAFDRLQILEYALYPILGWVAIVALPTMLVVMSGWELGLVLAGGLLYTVGIPVLVRERPDPWPRTFGYHEIWHAFTLAAGVCHFAAVGMLVR